MTYATQLLWYMYMILILFCGSKPCDFRFGSVAVKSPPALNNVWTRNIAAGWQMALYDYHQGTLYNMESITSNIQSLNNTCSMTMDIRDASYFNAQTVLTEIFDITELYKTNKLNIPIILGPEWSGISIITNPLVNTFDMMQISSGATSTALSESGYDSFFRTIPNDLVQSKALILLCKYFNWNSVGITYTNNNYGYSFQREIVEFGDKYDISTQSFAFVENDNATLKDAVESMKKSEIYVFILITTVFDLASFIGELKRNDMMGYPYFYLGNEAFYFTDKYNSDILNLYGGTIGSCPWSATMNNIFKYPYPVNVSLEMYKIYHTQWVDITKQSIDMRENTFYNISIPTTMSSYGYDSATTLIKAIDKFIETYNIKDIEQFDNVVFNGSGIDFKSILNDIWFIGLTGNVSFYPNGDRKGGLYSYCNVDPKTGSLNKIGFIIDSGNDLKDLVINEDDIQWPLQFVEQNINPSSEYKEYPGIATFSYLPIIVWSCTFLSVLVTIVYIFCIFYYREKKIIRASQYKLNLLMLFGCILAYIALIIFGIDESFPYNDISLQNPLNWDILCNIRIILLNMSFSFVFGPLLCKMYRINRIFNIGLQVVQLSAKQMALYNFIYVLIELIILIIIILFIPNYRIYIRSVVDGNTHFIEYYGSCTSGDYNIIYYIFLFIPKFIGMIYCLIISVSVYSTVYVMKFNEGLKIIFVILLSALLLTFGVCILFAININNASSLIAYYGFLSLILLIICNFASGLMLLPRFIAIWKGVDTVYESKGVKKLQKIDVVMNEFRLRLIRAKSITQSHNSDFDDVPSASPTINMDVTSNTNNNDTKKKNGGGDHTDIEIIYNK